MCNMREGADLSESWTQSSRPFWHSAFEALKLFTFFFHGVTKQKYQAPQIHLSRFTVWFNTWHGKKILQDCNLSSGMWKQLTGGIPTTAIQCQRGSIIHCSSHHKTYCEAYRGAAASVIDQYHTGLTEQNEAPAQQWVPCCAQMGLRWCHFCVASTGGGGLREKIMCLLNI